MILKKNAVNQIFFTMVDKADFATIESGLSAADIKVRLWGMNHGGSTATSALSLAAGKVSLVQSGLFRATLPAVNRDMLMARMSSTSTVSAAIQVMQFQLATYTDSDIYSYLSDMSSNTQSALASAVSDLTVIKSRVNKAVATASALASVASDVISMLSTVSQTKSQLASVYSDMVVIKPLITSLASDVISMLSTVSQLRVRMNYSTASDLASIITSAVWGANLNSQSMCSNIASAVWAHAVGTQVNSRVFLVQSRVSDIGSQVWAEKYTANSAASTFGSLMSDIYSRMVKTQSAVQPSQLNSVMWTTAAYGGSDVLSKVGKLTSRITKAVATNSQLSDAWSDINSLVGTIAAGALTDSNISDIVSAVWKYGLASQTGAGTPASALRAVQSRVQSKLNMAVSNVYSLVSDVDSALAITATNSDIASAVWGQAYSTHSLAGTFGSRFEKWAGSGMQIRASDLSAVRSAILAGPAATVTDADVSNIASAVWVRASGSDIVSKIGKLASRVTKEVAYNSQLSDLASDLKSVMASVWSSVDKVASRVPKMAATASVLSDFYSDFQSRVPKAVATNSQLSDLSSDLKSVLASVWSSVDKLTSRVPKAAATASVLSDFYSDFGSRVPKAVATNSQLSDLHSDLRSHLVVTSDIISKLYSTRLPSQYSDITSQLAIAMSASSDAASRATILVSRVPAIVATSDYLSNVYSGLHSFLSTTGIAVASAYMSDLRSAITAGPAAADVTSIAKAVWDMGYSDHLTASTFGSRLKAAATSDFVSKAQSSIESHVSGITATIDNASVASAVWANAIGTRVDSRLKLAQSQVSDIDSALSSQYTKVYSAVQAGGLNASAISDIASAVWGQKFKGAAAHNVASTFGSAFALATSRISDIDSAADSQYTIIGSRLNMANSRALLIQSTSSDAHSAAAQANSRALLIQSIASDAHSAAILGASHASDAYSVALLALSAISNVESALDSQYAAGQLLNASALSDVGSVIDARLDVAYTDATSLNANGLKDRLRTMGWILRNKMKVVDATGALLLYKDDDATTGFSVAAGVTNAGGSTLRKRLA